MSKESLSTHLKVRDTIMQTYSGAFYVDVTACGWVNPPKERMSSESSEVTCPQCAQSFSETNPEVS